MRTFAQKINQPQPEFSLQRNRLTQRTIGNQAEQALPQANAEERKAESGISVTTRFAHDFSRIPVYSKAPLSLQAKLTVNTPGDIYEQEADLVSEKVMARPAHPAVNGAPPHIQRFSGQSNGQIDAAPSSVDQVLASPGRPLGSALREDMERRFGHDFSRVRVYTGAAAEQSAQDMNAHAFTVGHNMVFAAGQFAPGTHEGRRLIAHELTHVVQQQGAEQRGSLTAGPTDDVRKREANIVSGAIASGAYASPVLIVGAAQGAKIQRQPSAKHPPKLTGSALEMDLVKKQQAVMRNQLKAEQLDLSWRAKFGERMSSYKQAIWRITYGLDAANRGFQDAQVAQAQTDQLTAQLLGLAGSVGFAIGFEWVFSFALGKLGVSTTKIANVVETVENPANAAVTGYISNVRGAKIAQHEAVIGQTPDTNIPGAGAVAGGSAVAFLADKSEALEQQWQRIEHAFNARSEKLKSLTDEQWETLDVGAQEGTYQALLNDLNSSGSGVEKLKSREKVANIIEKYLWIYWIKDVADRESGGRLWNFGTDIDLRLIKIGVEREAGVLLSEHWWQISSDDWPYLIDRWTRAYKESIVN